MPIADTISSIVAHRQGEIAPRYNTYWGEVKDVIAFSQKLKSLINGKNWCVLLEKFPEFNEVWTSADENGKSIENKVKSFIEFVSNNVGIKNGDNYGPKGYFEAIANKISKNEVEVCITGPVSTGKSVFLRALTGAPETVIPSGKGKTTAARTIFCNSAQKCAVVNFLTTKEFETIINEYVVQLNKELKKRKKEEFPMWDSVSKSLTDYCKVIKAHSSYKSQNFSKSTIAGVDTTVTADLYFDTFTLYIDNYGHYTSYLDREPKHINSKDIEEGKLVPYVSYKMSENYQGDPYCRALAVREAVVNWPLKTVNGEDLGSIRLVDTMGIGEAKFCVEEDLLKTVREHADLAVALCRILSDNDNADNANNSCFIKVLSKIRDRKMEDWVYYLCNKEDEGNITDETVEAFKLQIWKEMQNNADYFTLNDEYWKSIRFIQDGKENSNAIVDYFVNIVLGKLEENISAVDKFFLDKLKDEYESCIKKKNQIIKDLKSCLNVLPAFSCLDKTKKIDERVDSIFVDLSTELTKLRADLFIKDATLRQQIINSVRPILKDPEIFNVYGINDVNYDVKAAFTSLFKNTLLAINESILAIDTFDIVWTDIKKDVVSKTAERMGKDKSEVEKLIGQAEKFFEDYLKKCCQAIQSNMKFVKTNLNVDDPNHSCNYTGRELEFFIHTREQLYKAIWDKMSHASEHVGIKEKDVNDVKESLCKVVKTKMEKHKIVEEKDVPPITWMQNFADQINSDYFKTAILEFLDSIVDLPSIVDDQTGKELRRKLLNVSLRYSDETTAAKSIWNSLCVLDIILRDDLLHKYEQTFKKYDVYVNLVTPLFDNVFCTNQNDYGKSKAEPYKEFRAYVKTIVTSNYEKEDTAKCEDAASQYRALCK
ncbi:MAG: hypothetical protein MJ000_03850 [Bacteroidales bacterium]|nr:hypothetical protein [Bacteroidales bacterium]